MSIKNENKKISFTFTPQIFRYLEDIIKLNDEELSNDIEENWIMIKTYVQPEKATIQSEANNSQFWSYLQEIKAIKLSTKNKLFVGNKVEIETIERSDKKSKKWIYFPEYKFRILDINKIKTLLLNRNKNYLIKPKTLELISKEIGDIDSGVKLVEFLKNCGVMNELIIYPNTKWRMINDVFRTLATSSNPKAKKILFRIIEEATHPLTHNGDEEVAKKYEDKFNKLLKYDNLVLRNCELKEIAVKTEQDNNLDLYLKKKILLEKWRDDLPHPITELSLKKNTLEQICYSLWDLFVFDIISFGANTFPEDIFVETDPRFHKEIAFNWKLIRNLDNNQYNIDSDYGFDIEIINEKKLKEIIDEEIKEFIYNKMDSDKVKSAKESCPDAEYLETPSYLQGLSSNYYSYLKQRKIVLNYIAILYKKFENQILVLQFNKIKDPSINILRTILALESEGFFTIKELRNNKKEWTDEDNVYAKISIDKDDIPIINSFKIKDKTTEKQTEKQQKNIGDIKSNNIQEPISLKIVEMPELKIKGFEEKVVLQKPKNKKIHLRKFPADLRWEEITIKFLNNHEVIIGARDAVLQTTYETMGFQDEKRKLPNKQWLFLKGLSETQGELSWNSPKASDKGKKQKQLLSETLKAYFQIKDEPFYNYRKEKAYKIKINLVAEIDSKTILKNNTTERNNKDNYDIEEYRKEQSPEI